jgi:glucose-fructose oxidoreductase
MAPSSADCIAMIDAARSNNVKLMIAYRLHFDPSTLDAIELATSGKLGQLRIFSSAFSQVVKEGNIRVEEPGWMGGGSVWDMGIYCINAARYLLRDEPFEVTAFSENSDSQKFRDVDEMTSAIMRFHGYRLASFTSSFGASSTSQLLLVGDRGRLEIDSAYDYSKGHQHRITIDGETMMKNYPKVDQFSAEIDYFSSCIIENREPEPSGEEGLADVRVIEAVYQSAMSCRPIGLAPFQRQQRPSKQQVIQRPAHAEPERVKVSSPGK